MVLTFEMHAFRDNPILVGNFPKFLGQQHHHKTLNLDRAIYDENTEGRLEFLAFEFYWLLSTGPNKSLNSFLREFKQNLTNFRRIRP